MIIYKIEDPRINKVIYVGKTENFELRKITHLRSCHNPALKKIIKSIIKSGHYPVFSKIQNCKPERGHKVENKWINFYYEKGHPICNKIGLRKGKYKPAVLYIDIKKYRIIIKIAKMEKIKLSDMIIQMINAKIESEAANV